MLKRTTLNWNLFNLNRLEMVFGLWWCIAAKQPTSISASLTRASGKKSSANRQATLKKSVNKFIFLFRPYKSFRRLSQIDLLGTILNPVSTYKTFFCGHPISCIFLFNKFFGIVFKALTNTELAWKLLCNFPSRASLLSKFSKDGSNWWWL